MKIVVKAGGLLDRILGCVAAAVNYFLPESLSAVVECRLCGREIEGGDIKRHLTYFHPDIQLGGHL